MWGLLPVRLAAHAINTFTPLALLALALAGCTPSANTGGAATRGPTLDEITPWLKIEYYPKTPKSPAYVSGQPSVIPIAQLAAVFTAIGSDANITKATYDYCN